MTAHQPKSARSYDINVLLNVKQQIDQLEVKTKRSDLKAENAESMIKELKIQVEKLN